MDHVFVSLVAMKQSYHSSLEEDDAASFSLYRCSSLCRELTAAVNFATSLSAVFLCCSTICSTSLISMRSIWWLSSVVTPVNSPAIPVAIVFVAPGWAESCRAAYCTGYAEAGGQDPRTDPVMLRACETDKAVYEVAYEHANRPEWLTVPLSSIARITGEGAVQS